MALRKPLVQVAGQVQQLQAGDTLDAPITSPQIALLTNGEAAPVVIGSIVYIFSAATFKKAQANAALTTNARIGIVSQSPSIANGVAGTVALNGPVVATTGQWDAVTGDVGGLTPGSEYFIDAATAGKITKTAPSVVGQYVAPIGTAIDTVTLMVDLDATTILL